MHWYDRNTGLLLSQKTTASGSLRDYDLRDARKDLALPGVTTVLSTLDKPGLKQWSYEQVAIAAANNHGQRLDYTVEEWHKLVRQEAFTVVDEAAEFGTAVHAGLRAGFEWRLGGPLRWLPTDVRVRLVVDGFWPWWDSVLGPMLLSCPEAICEPCIANELSFTNCEWGYAGTADMRTLACTDKYQNCIIDFKTQDAETERDFNFYEPDYPLQLAGYALGLGEVDAQRISVLISRTRPGLCALKVWPDNDRYLAMWISLLQFWQHSKNYYPGSIIKPLELVGWSAVK